MVVRSIIPVVMAGVLGIYGAELGHSGFSRGCSKTPLRHWQSDIELVGGEPQDFLF